MAAGSIVVDLLMKTSSFETDSKRAEKRMQEMHKAIQRTATAIGVATGAAAVAMGVMVKSSIDNADRLSKLAQSTGIATEALSQLEYAAGLSGASSDELGAALGRLNRSATEAAEGTKLYADAYEKLGVSVTGTSGQMKDSETLLIEVSEAFSKLQDGPAKAALAMDLFGKAGANLIPFLNNGRAGLEALREEAAAFGLTVDSEAAKAAEVFNDNLSRLGAAATGVTNQLAQRMLPTLAGITDAMVSVAKESSLVSSISDALAAALRGVAVVGVNVAYVMVGIGREIGGLAAQAAAVAQLDFRGAGAIGDAMKEDAKAAREEVDRLTASVMGANAAGSGSSPSVSAVRNAVALTVPKVKSTGAPKVSDLERMSKAFADQAATVGKTSEEIELYRYKLAGASPAQLAFAASVQDSIRSFEAQAKAMSDGKSVTEAVRTPAEAYSAEVERLNALLNQAAISQETYNRAVFAAQDVLDGTNESLQSLNAMLDATPTAKLEKSRADMLLLRDAFVAGKISAEEFVEAAGTRLGTLPDTIDTATDSMSAFADQAARNMQGAFADFLFDPFADGVDGMLNSFGITLRRMAAEAAAAKIFNAVGDWGKSNSNSGGFLGAISSIIGVFGGARADGGSVMSGKTYLVGERGPEYFRPGTSGTIVPNEAIGRSSSDMTINQTIYAGQGTDHAQVRRSAAAGARSALGVMSGARRYG